MSRIRRYPFDVFFSAVSWRSWVLESAGRATRLPALDNAHAGFTLIELLVVIAIIGILATVVLVAVNPAQRIAEATDSQIRTDLGQMRDEIEAYATSHQGLYPSTGGQYWCESCTQSGWYAKGKDNWIPGLVSSGYATHLPASPRSGSGSGFAGCVAANATYLYMSYPAHNGYKLFAFCTPKTGLNRSPFGPPSPYCPNRSLGWIDGYSDKYFTADPGGTPNAQLKLMVDPVRYTTVYAVYSDNYTCL